MPPPPPPPGVTSICMHTGYVPQKRPPFSALNFRSGDQHFQNFFNFNLFIASHGRLSPNAAPRVSQTRPGSSGESHFQRHGLARRVLAASGESHFQHRGLARLVMAVPESPIFMLKRMKLVPEPPIFKLKMAQAHPGDPHFHAQLGARSGALAIFSLCRGTYLPKFGVSTPPPPPKKKKKN